MRRISLKSLTLCVSFIAVGLAALRSGLVEAPAGGTMVLVVSGGNASRAGLAGLAEA